MDLRGLERSGRTGAMEPGRPRVPSRLSRGSARTLTEPSSCSAFLTRKTFILSDEFRYVGKLLSSEGGFCVLLKINQVHICHCLLF